MKLSLYKHDMQVVYHKTDVTSSLQFTFCCRARTTSSSYTSDDMIIQLIFIALMQIRYSLSHPSLRRPNPTPSLSSRIHLLSPYQFTSEFTVTFPICSLSSGPESSEYSVCMQHSAGVTHSRAHIQVCMKVLSLRRYVSFRLKACRHLICYLRVT